MTLLSPQAEAALDWYFGEGASLFERSTFGAMLERSSMYKVKRTVDPELMRARLEREPHEAPPGALTARPKSGQAPSSGYTPEESLLSRYARVSRLVRAVLEQDELSAAVLGAYYGDIGARWGRSPYGRIFAVYPLTAAGRELLRRERARQSAGKAPSSTLTPAEELGVVMSVQAIQPQPARRVLADRARIESYQCYERACALYREASRCTTSKTRSSPPLTSASSSRSPSPSGSPAPSLRPPTLRRG